MSAPAHAPPFVQGLRCLRCGRARDFDPAARVCLVCSSGDAEDPGIQDVEIDLVRARPVFDDALARTGPGAGMSRYAALLPNSDPTLLPHAGDTPLVSAPALARRLGLAALHFKDERANPSGCLKDRATAVAIGLAREQGHRDLCCASAGNAAVSLATLSAAAGLESHVFVPHQVSASQLARLYELGTDVHVSSGNYDDAFAESERWTATHPWYSRNCAFNPFLVEGKKTVSYEIAEQLGWRAPDVVAVAVGDGCTLGAIGKGFRELLALGRTERTPRLMGVQSEAIQPLVARFRGGARSAATGETLATSIAVRRPRNATRVLREVNASGGTLIAVPDLEIGTAQELLANETGIRAEFTSAAALAGVLRMAPHPAWAGRTVVIVVTAGAPS
jgi:threonine synthase